MQNKPKSKPVNVHTIQSHLKKTCALGIPCLAAMLLRNNRSDSCGVYGLGLVEAHQSVVKALSYRDEAITKFMVT
jgi:hypothetical protein